MRRLFTASRYPVHGVQQVQAYIGLMSPSAYISNPAALSAADMLRRVTMIAYRTRELQLAWPDDGFATGEREIWENDEAWQPARKAIEYALTTYDWGEAFTAMNLVLLPTLDDVLLRQLGRTAKANGDDLTWLLTSFLQRDVDRRKRWSAELARHAIAQNSANEAVLRRWIEKWTPLADDAAKGLGSVFEALPNSDQSASDVAGEAAAAREKFLTGAGLSGSDASGNGHASGNGQAAGNGHAS